MQPNKVYSLQSAYILHILPKYLSVLVKIMWPIIIWFTYVLVLCLYVKIVIFKITTTKNILCMVLIYLNSTSEQFIIHEL